MGDNAGPFCKPDQAAVLAMQPNPAQAHLYLASASPRRRELLAQVQLVPMLLPQDIDESVLAGESPDAYVKRLASAKAASALRDVRYQQALPVLAADTTVVCEGQILGKPATLDEARTMLRLLSGRAHRVLTAVAVGLRAKTEVILVSTSVHFREIDENEIAAYWASGEPQDKAGGYGIQGLGALFVSHIEGSYSGVMGLPLFETLQLLKEFGVDPLAQSRAVQGVAV
jgi:septum formation protein